MRARESMIVFQKMQAYNLSMEIYAVVTLHSHPILVVLNKTFCLRPNCVLP